MDLLKYLTLSDTMQQKTRSEYLPDTSSPLVITMPSGSITATKSP